MTVRDLIQKIKDRVTVAAARFLTPREFRAVIAFLGIGVAALLWRGGKSLLYTIFPPAQSEQFRMEEHRQDSIFTFLSSKKFNEDSLKFWTPTESSSSDSSHTTRSAKGKDLAPASISLNSASRSDLQKLPGVGEVMSTRILEYRQKHKKFRSLEELMEVNGIGEKKFAKMKDYLKLD